MRSSAGGAVGKNPVVLRVVKQFIQPNMKALDFGAGKFARQTAHLRAMGFNVTAHDYHNRREHDENALDRKYDLVFSSNVLNVQNSHAQLLNTVHKVAKATAPHGMYIANLPQPLYDAYRGMKPAEAAQKLEGVLRTRFGEVSRFPMAGHRIWICKRPLI
jgi:hypothetical protein